MQSQYAKDMALAKRLGDPFNPRNCNNPFRTPEQIIRYRMSVYDAAVALVESLEPDPDNIWWPFDSRAHFRQYVELYRSEGKEIPLVPGNLTDFYIWCDQMRQRVGLPAATGKAVYTTEHTDEIAYLSANPRSLLTAALAGVI